MYILNITTIPRIPELNAIVKTIFF